MLSFKLTNKLLFVFKINIDLSCLIVCIIIIYIFLLDYCCIFELNLSYSFPLKILKDLPEYFEDNMKQWMSSFHTLLVGSFKVLETDVCWFFLMIELKLDVKVLLDSLNSYSLQMNWIVRLCLCCLVNWMNKRFRIRDKHYRN